MGGADRATGKSLPLPGSMRMHVRAKLISSGERGQRSTVRPHRPRSRAISAPLTRSAAVRGGHSGKASYTAQDHLQGWIRRFASGGRESLRVNKASSADVADRQTPSSYGREQRAAVGVYDMRWLADAGGGSVVASISKSAAKPPQHREPPPPRSGLYPHKNWYRLCHHQRAGDGSLRRSVGRVRSRRRERPEAWQDTTPHRCTGRLGGWSRSAMPSSPSP